MSKGLKNTQADVWFSKCVRIRPNWTCENCGINLEHNTGGLDCSHFISRGVKSVRWHPRNALSHCKACHKKLGGDRWGGGNVAEFAHHYDSILGAENRELMRLLSKETWRGYKNHIKLIAEHFKEEYKRMEAIRADGEIGRLEFSKYEGCYELTKAEKDIMTCLDG